jgi:hypothetical protein
MQKSHDRIQSAQIGEICQRSVPAPTKAFNVLISPISRESGLQ